MRLQAGRSCAALRYSTVQYTVRLYCCAQPMPSLAGARARLKRALRALRDKLQYSFTSSSNTKTSICLLADCIINAEIGVSMATL